MGQNYYRRDGTKLFSAQWDVDVKTSTLIENQIENNKKIVSNLYRFLLNAFVTRKSAVNFSKVPFEIIFPCLLQLCIISFPRSYIFYSCKHMSYFVFEQSNQRFTIILYSFRNIIYYVTTQMVLQQNTVVDCVQKKVVQIDIEYEVFLMDHCLAPI